MIFVTMMTDEEVLVKDALRFTRCFSVDTFRMATRARWESVWMVIFKSVVYADAPG